MKPTNSALNNILMLSLVRTSQGAPCPMANTMQVPPNDAIHSGLQKPNLRRRIVSLSENPDTKAKLDTIINDRKQRMLQEECLNSGTYDAIDADIEAIAATFLDDESRSHFLGGVVRLAAHDFLDYNKDDPISPFGSDGCIEFEDSHNAGLEDIWCTGCDLTTLYDETYSHVSKADFWVVAANSVIRQTSSDALNLKDSFVWGRVDNASCQGSALRLPETSGCNEVEEVFLTRLGLSRRDTVALLGAHTLGRGDASFSGHHGIWVDTVSESLVFNKRYYEEIIRRAWIPRNENADNQDWTWGGRNGNSPRFMLNVDMCLRFDIEHTFPCCTRIDRLANDNITNPCGILSETPCSSYDISNARFEFADAVNEFATGGGNNIGNTLNGPWYEAFEAAWNSATTNGLSNPRPLAQGCTLSPTSQPTQNPTTSPTTSSPTATCHDVPSFVDNKGRERDCSWVVADGSNRCVKFAHLCPSTCGECDCLLNKRICLTDDECCSGDCVNGQCACLPRRSLCSSNDVCCSGVCQVDGTCAGGTGTGG